MKNILITGIAGFIGSATAKKLKEDGYNVVGVDNFNNYYNPEIKRNRANRMKMLGINVFNLDLLKDDLTSLLVDEEIDAILHIAASAGVRPSIDEPEFFVQNNILVTTRVLEAARKNNIKNFVFASSSSVYGNLINSKTKSISEDDIENKIYSPYAATKLACEEMINVYSNLYSIKSISLRYFTVFGPDQRPDLAIIKFIKAINDDKKIDKFGDGNTFRDYTYIDDVVAANIASLEYNEKQIVNENIILNICSNNPVTLNDLIHTIESQMGKRANVNETNMQLGDVYGTYGNNSKAKRILGWEPKMNFSDGISKTISWLKSKEKEAL